MNGTQTEHIKGRCIEIGDDDDGQPRLIIHTTREEIMRFCRNLAFRDVVVTLVDKDMTGTLFDVPVQLSPRLQWIMKHHVITYHSRPGEEDACWFAAFDRGDWKYSSAEDYFAQEIGEFGEDRVGIGDTEDEAIVDLCKYRRVPLWNEEAK